MTLLDTDILTLAFSGHSQVSERVRNAKEMPATSIVSRIEMLRGRFDSILKAADSVQLLSAQDRLAATERELAKLRILPFNPAAAAIFEKLRHQRNLKRVGRADLLIACIALAHNATLVTRNLRHFA
jgi:tRNA(fMet)-specific endonuclease VapC